jgi:Delta24-sterol reductase
MEVHNAAVAAISVQVKTFYQNKTPFRLYHGSTNSTQVRKVDRTRIIDTSGLKHVLSIDYKKKTCLVEPNVAMDELVDAVVPHGFLPPVVMEFPGITVGGGFAGTAGESSGFKYGFFDATVNWFEIVLPDGEVARCSANEREDLFHGAAGTCGTLGVATLFELQLLDYKPYVELTYHPVTSVKDALETMKLATEVEANDYVDGILYAQDRGVIVTGQLTNSPPPKSRIQHFSGARDPWFYMHVERTASRQVDPVKETVPIRDYLFRYDRGAFWTGKYAFTYFITPFNRITRWALDYFMHTRVMYHALHASGHSNKYIIQDLLLPAPTAEAFINYISADFNFWPLWLCPLKVGSEVAMHPDLAQGAYKEDKTIEFVNVGVWGPGPTNYDRFVAVNRKLEAKVREYGGIKWLYAQGFYTEAEFWSIYDRKWYQALREKYKATYLPDVYQKVRVDLAKMYAKPTTWKGWVKSLVWDVWPVSGVYGVLKTLYEREYLLAK